MINKMDPIVSALKKEEENRQKIVEAGAARDIEKWVNFSFILFPRFPLFWFDYIVTSILYVWDTCKYAQAYYYRQDFL